VQPGPAGHRPSRPRRRPAITGPVTSEPRTTARAAPWRRVFYGWWMVAGLALTELVSWGVLVYAFSVFVVPMRAEFGWSTAQLNGAYTAGDGDLEPGRHPRRALAGAPRLPRGHDHRQPARRRGVAGLVERAFTGDLLRG